MSDLDAAERGYVASILEGGDQLLALIDQLTDASYLERTGHSDPADDHG
jgi:hypothetical protein